MLSIRYVRSPSLPVTHFMTAAIKANLRRKNRFVRAGRVEEANALAKRIDRDITRRCQTRLRKVDGKVDVKGTWAAVRQLTGRQQDSSQVDGITAESLNQHYATISTDSNYRAPVRKQSAAHSCTHPIRLSSLNGGCSSYLTSCVQLLPVSSNYQRGSSVLEHQSSASL